MHHARRRKLIVLAVLLVVVTATVVVTVGSYRQRAAQKELERQQALWQMVVDSGDGKTLAIDIDFRLDNPTIEAMIADGVRRGMRPVVPFPSGGKDVILAKVQLSHTSGMPVDPDLARTAKRALEDQMKSYGVKNGVATVTGTVRTAASIYLWQTPEGKCYCGDDRIGNNIDKDDDMIVSPEEALRALSFTVCMEFRQGIEALNRAMAPH